MSNLINRNFMDVTDSMSSIIEEVNRYKVEYKIEEANDFAYSYRDEIGDMMSAESINEIESAISTVAFIVLGKKRFAYFNDDIDKMKYNGQILLGEIEMDIIEPNGGGD